MQRILALSAVMACLASQAAAWEFIYIDGNEAGSVKACGAVQEYNDGFFLIRLLGDEIDFLIRIDKLTLPYDAVLGNVALVFPDNAFILSGSTNAKEPDDSASTTSHFFLSPKKEDFADLFDYFRRENKVSIVFPTEIPTRSASLARGGH